MNSAYYDVLAARWEDQLRATYEIDPDEEYRNDHGHDICLTDIYAVYRPCDGATDGDDMEVACPICDAPVRGPAGREIASLRVIEVSTAEPSDYEPVE